MVKPYPRQELPIPPGSAGDPGGVSLADWPHPIDLQVNQGQWTDGQALEELVLNQCKPLVVAMAIGSPWGNSSFNVDRA